MFDSADMVGWLLALFRASALLLSMPIMSHASFPRTARIGFAAVLAWLVQPEGAATAYPTDLLALGLMVMKEVVIGVLMGFAVRCVFAVIDFAAQIIAVEMGLTPAPAFDSASTVAGSPLGTGLFYLGVVIFFSGAHYAVVLAFARSLELIPPGLQPTDVGFVSACVKHVAHILELGVLIAAPFMAVNFLINLTFSLLGRVVPRLNVFVLSFSVRTFAGLSLLAVSGGLFAHHLLQDFRALPEVMLRFLPFAVH